MTNPSTFIANPENSFISKWDPVVISFHKLNKSTRNKRLISVDPNLELEVVKALSSVIGPVYLEKMTSSKAK